MAEPGAARYSRAQSGKARYSQVLPGTGMFGASSGACLRYVLGIIWGMSGACLGQRMGHIVNNPRCFMHL